jgi:Flp pilus assembly protein TadB
MEMKIVIIAALGAAQLAAAACPAQAAERPEAPAAKQARFEGGAELRLPDATPAMAARAGAAQDEEPRKKKRKSTGDKVLTGAAVILGVGALAVGGLLVAIFVN